MVARGGRHDLGRGDRLLGAATVADRPRETSAPALAQLRAQGAGLARMSGSGATCFGLYVSPRAAAAAAKSLSAAHPKWWVKATSFG